MTDKTTQIEELLRLRPMCLPEIQAATDLSASVVRKLLRKVPHHITHFDSYGSGRKELAFYRYGACPEMIRRIHIRVPKEDITPLDLEQAKAARELLAATLANPKPDPLVAAFFGIGG